MYSPDITNTDMNNRMDRVACTICFYSALGVLRSRHAHTCLTVNCYLVTTFIRYISRSVLFNFAGDKKINHTERIFTSQ